MLYIDEMLSPNRLTEIEYDRERQRLKELYGGAAAQQAEVMAKRDQAYAALFHRSGWTQDELAKKEGKTIAWVAYRLRFGRFLNFSTTVENPQTLPSNLTERRFRSYWERTSGGNDRQRFDAVIKLMVAETQLVSPINKPIWRDIVDKFGDGKWYGVNEISEALQTSADHISNSLNTMEGNTKTERQEARDQACEYLLWLRFRVECLPRREVHQRHQVDIQDGTQGVGIRCSL